MGPETVNNPRVRVLVECVDMLMGQLERALPYVESRAEDLLDISAYAGDPANGWEPAQASTANFDAHRACALIAEIRRTLGLTTPEATAVAQ